MAEKTESVGSSTRTSDPNIQEQYPNITEIVEERIYPFFERVFHYLGFG